MIIPPISTILTLRKLPLLLHIIIESAAAYTFILKPSCQLPPSLLLPSPDQEASEDSSPACFASGSGSSSCPCHGPRPEETCQQPSKRYLSPSLSPSPNISPLDNNNNRHEHTDRDGNTPPPAAAIQELNLLLLNYGGLLLTSNLICLIFVFRPVFDQLSGLVSLCMATYHVWPVWRAWVRLRMSMSNKGTDRKTKPKAVLGGPAVHLAVHLGLLGGLVWGGLFV